MIDAYNDMKEIVVLYMCVDYILYYRLYHLIKLVGGVEVREFSSGLHTAKRNRILQQFSKGKIDM